MDFLLRDNVIGSLLASVPLGHDEKSDLVALMSGVDRHYHGVDHLAILWERHELYGGAAGLRGPDIDRLIACAIAYHDAIYHPERHDNEERSADLWLEVSGDGGMSDHERAWVADTIRATSDHLAYAPTILEAGERLPVLERARLWLLDLDLTPLGEDPDVFDANTERLRAESSMFAPADFDRMFMRFLRRLDSAHSIFRSPVLAAAFQTRALENVRRHINKLIGSVPDKV